MPKVQCFKIDNDYKFKLKYHNHVYILQILLELQLSQLNRYIHLSLIFLSWLIGGDLTVFEGLGWDRRAPAASNTEVNKFLGHDVYIGFLGQYTREWHITS